MKSKQLGYMIVGISIIVIIMMFSFSWILEQQQIKACEESCLENDGICSLEACPFHQQGNRNNLFIISFVSVLVAFLGGLGAYLAFAKSEEVITTRIYDVSKLNDEEKRAFSMIKEHKEGIYQSTLISKVRMTRILDRLEGLGLIERRRRGMANMIFVK